MNENRDNAYLSGAPAGHTSPEVLIVGAGFSGAVCARELAEAGIRCQVIDQRPHVAGNCHTERDAETGIMVHRYGPHIFNTDLEEVWHYVNRYAEFSPFINRVKAHTSRGIFSLPINLHTLNQFFDRRMNPQQAKQFVSELGDKSIAAPTNFEEQALSMIGRELYETFFKGYTIKQWGEDPKNLPASVFRRLPIRFDYNDAYYDKKYAGIPREGYTELVRRILDHSLIRVDLSTAYQREMSAKYRHTVFTGAIDRYFDYEEGQLGYRTVYWEQEKVEGDYQGVACMNYPGMEVPWTRSSEHKHYLPDEQHAQSLVFREFSKESGIEDELFYPKRLAGDKIKLEKYQQLAAKERQVTFLGRLGTYQYLDMDRSIAAALKAAKGLNL